MEIELHKENLPLGLVAPVAMGWLKRDAGQRDNFALVGGDLIHSFKSLLLGR